MTTPTKVDYVVYEFADAQRAVNHLSARIAALESAPALPVPAIDQVHDGSFRDTCDKCEAVEPALSVPAVETVADTLGPEICPDCRRSRASAWSRTGPQTGSGGALCWKHIIDLDWDREDCQRAATKAPAENLQLREKVAAIEAHSALSVPAVQNLGTPVHGPEIRKAATARTNEPGEPTVHSPGVPNLSAPPVEPPPAECPAPLDNNCNCPSCQAAKVQATAEPVSHQSAKLAASRLMVGHLAEPKCRDAYNLLQRYADEREAAEDSLREDLVEARDCEAFAVASNKRLLAELTEIQAERDKYIKERVDIGNKHDLHMADCQRAKASAIPDGAVEAIREWREYSDLGKDDVYRHLEAATFRVAVRALRVLASVPGSVGENR